MTHCRVCGASEGIEGVCPMDRSHSRMSPSEAVDRALAELQALGQRLDAAIREVEAMEKVLKELAGRTN